VISLTPLVEHLKPIPAGFTGLWFRAVGGAAEYARIEPQALPLPACWVVRAADQVRHAGERTEDATFLFDVVIALENVRMHDVGDTDDELLIYRRAVKALLLGWEIAPDVRPIKWGGGRVLEYTDGDIYWADRYAFDALITNYLPDPPMYAGVSNQGEH
jgi:hypothetical protein